MAVKGLWLFVAMVLTLESVSCCLNLNNVHLHRHCPRCDDCDNEEETTEKCKPLVYDHCMTYTSENIKHKRCAPMLLCNKLEAQNQGDGTALTIPEVEKIALPTWYEDVIKDGVKGECCNEHFCNGDGDGKGFDGAPTMSNMGVLLFVLPGVLYLLGY